LGRRFWGGRKHPNRGGRENQECRHNSGLKKGLRQRQKQKHRRKNVGARERSKKTKGGGKAIQKKAFDTCEGRPTGSSKKTEENTFKKGRKEGRRGNKRLVGEETIKKRGAIQGGRHFYLLPETSLGETRKKYLGEKKGGEISKFGQ